MWSHPRILGAVVGDLIHEPTARIKYGYFFKALSRAFPVPEVFDAGLHGLERLRNALAVISPDLRLWRERFYKNVIGFRQRSELVANHLKSRVGTVDMILQVGVLFDSLRYDSTLPSLIYTDYTAAMSARRKEAGRSPFTETDRLEWMRMERLAYERASHICVRAGFVRDSLISDYGIAESKISVVGGGMNLSVLPELMLHPEKEGPVLLFIGKELYRKGGDLLLEAFARTRSQFPKAKLLMLTRDRIPRGLPLHGVELIKPTWNRAVILELYRRADVCVLPSRLETWGDVLVEAMAHSLPCIGVNGEAMDDIIEHGRTGLIVPNGDVKELQQAILTLMESRRLRLQFGSAGRHRVEEHFTWDKVITRMEPAILATGAQMPQRNALLEPTLKTIKGN